VNNLAIIPARGGSKWIPRKSIKSFLGFPMYPTLSDEDQEFVIKKIISFYE